ncbi:rho GTPase-activating protein 30-like [Acipenser ruthenus]|uniref:rho GTPase-activating protein 30-like n=1 Tax=Acipenser ruthenus TaxID=7906 RepID=UPI0027415090|nr:rho GTPase-activating protein 30-like [Acipenser ruthenus]
MKGRQKGKRKGGNKDRVFGCDLREHLNATGQEIPLVLRACSSFVEEHGVVDGIYRLSGVSSNTQKLRNEFDSETSPDLNRDVYLQDIHCVSSLCKAYFRELPNPLLTYQLYDKFADAVAIQLEEERLVKIKDVLKELPDPHYRTLEFLMRHLIRMASFSHETNMHARNLAIVWAPNLLRSKDIESGFNGTAAFMEVRIQSIVVEFILMHVEQLFNDASGDYHDHRPKSLPSPTFLPNQEEPYFRALPFNMPSALSPGDGPPQMRPYHAIIEVTDTKRKGSLKVKKWKSIFNLGRSNNNDKRKGKGEGKDKSKAHMRPAKSMDSLSSLPCTLEDSVIQRSSARTPIRHESFGPSEHQPSSLPPSPLTTTSLGADSGAKGSQGYAVTYRRGGGASVSVVGGAVGGAEAGLGSSSLDNLSSNSPKGRGNRAERCAGVHISGPFSVTVPLHITSGLALGVLQGANGDKGAGKAEEEKRTTAEDSPDLGAKVQQGDEEKNESEVPLSQEEEGLQEAERQEVRETDIEVEMEAAESGHSGRGSSISSEEEEEHLEEEEYMDMRGSIERPSELPLDFLDTFGFLDDDMMDTGEGATQFEEFSVEPPCYEDEDCCSFSSEMYEPPPSLPSQLDQLNQFKTEGDSDEDVQFYSLPDYLDRPDLRIWETDAPAAARIDHETDQLEDTGDPAEENDQTAPSDTLDLQGSRGQSDEGVKPTSGPGDEGRWQCAGDAVAGTPTQDSETSYTCGEMRAIDLNSRDPPEEPGDTLLLLCSTGTSDMQSFVESSRGCPTEAQIESVAGLESGSSLCSTDVPQLAQDPEAALQGNSIAVLEASEMPAEGNTDGKQLRVEPEGIAQPEGSGVDEGPIGDPEKLLGNQEALPEILQDDETGGVCKEDEKQAVASYEDSKDGLAKVRVFVQSLVDHSLASIETHGKNACSEMGSVLVGKAEIVGNELSPAEADPVKQMDVEVDSVEEVIMEEGGGSEAGGVDGTGDHETGGMVQEVEVGGSSDGNEDAEEIEEGFTREMEEATGKPEGLGEVTEEELKESGDAGREMGVASAKVGNDQTGSEKEGVEGDGSKHSREREDSETQREARLEGMEGARMQVVASVPTKPRPKLYQVKSVPVVAPKPQFSKLPPALKIKHQLHQQDLQSQLPGSEGESKGRGKNRWSYGGREGEAEGEGERGKRNGATPGASLSFDEAVARARDRHCNLKVWRIQAYGEQSSLQALPKQLRHSHCDLTGQAPPSPNPRPFPRGGEAKRMSLPRIGQSASLPETEEIIQQRRSFAALDSHRDKERESE